MNSSDTVFKCSITPPNCIENIGLILMYSFIIVILMKINGITHGMLLDYSLYFKFYFNQLWPNFIPKISIPTYIHVQTIYLKSLYKPYCISESFNIHISTYIRCYSLTTGSIIFKIIIVFLILYFNFVPLPGTLQTSPPNHFVLSFKCTPFYNNCWYNIYIIKAIISNINEICFVYIILLVCIF